MRKDATARRDRIIEVAADLFEREGYDIPLEAVITAAGLGRGTLYRNFPDRAALMAAVLTYKLAGMEQFVAAHHDDATLLQAFVRRKGLLASLHAPAIARLVAEDTHNQALAVLTERTSALLSDIVVRSHAAGTLRPDASVAHLRLVTRMLMMTATEPAGEQVDSLDMAVDIVMCGLAQRLDKDS